MGVARWNPPRWSLGASALAGLVIAGCGAAATPPSTGSLRAADQQRLLALIARTRTAAANHDVSAVRIELGRFVADVRALHAAGALGAATATSLDRQALATEAQVSQQFRSAATEDVGRTVTATASNSGTSPETGTAAAAVGSTTTGTATPSAQPLARSSSPAAPPTGQPGSPSPPQARQQDPGRGDGPGGPAGGPPEDGIATPPGAGPHRGPGSWWGWSQGDPGAGSGNGWNNQRAGDWSGGGND